MHWRFVAVCCLSLRTQGWKFAPACSVRRHRPSRVVCSSTVEPTVVTVVVTTTTITTRPGSRSEAFTTTTTTTTTNGAQGPATTAMSSSDGSPGASTPAETQPAPQTPSAAMALPPSSDLPAGLSASFLAGLNGATGADSPGNWDEDPPQSVEEEIEVSGGRGKHQNHLEARGQRHLRSLPCSPESFPSLDYCARILGGTRGFSQNLMKTSQQRRRRQWRRRPTGPSPRKLRARRDSPRA